MAIPATTQGTPSQSVIEFTIGNPNAFPTSSTSQQLGNPAQANVPILGTPTNVVLGYDSIQVQVAIPGNSGAILTTTTVSGIASFPNIPLPLVTGNTQPVYCLLIPSGASVVGNFLPGAQLNTMSYRLAQGTNTATVTATPGYVASGVQPVPPVTQIGRVQSLPQDATINGITLNFSQVFYNLAASPAAGIALLTYTVLLLSNTGYVSQLG